VDVARQAGIRYVFTIRDSRPLTILGSIGNGCAFLDYDNSGDLSVLLVGERLALYKGDGRGHFTDVTHRMGLDKLRGRFLGCAVGDYDNDGYDDIYLSGYQTGLLLHNEKGKGFKDVTVSAGLKPQPWGTSCGFADLSGEGRLDLVVANYVKFGPRSTQLCRDEDVPAGCPPVYYNPEMPVFYRNLGGGRFRDESQASGIGQAHGRGLAVAFADYDDSGRQSVLIANDDLPGDLFHNEGGGRFTNAGIRSGIALDANSRTHSGMGPCRRRLRQRRPHGCPGRGQRRGAAAPAQRYRARRPLALGQARRYAEQPGRHRCAGHCHSGRLDPDAPVPYGRLVPVGVRPPRTSGAGAGRSGGTPEHPMAKRAYRCLA